MNQELNQKAPTPFKKNQTFTPETGILPQIPKNERYNLIGQIASLMLSSKLHRKYLIDDIGAMFLPAIHLNQFRIYKNKNGDPVGIVTWAFFSDELEAKYKKGEKVLNKLEDWKSGEMAGLLTLLLLMGMLSKLLKIYELMFSLKKKEKL